MSHLPLMNVRVGVDGLVPIRPWAWRLPFSVPEARPRPFGRVAASKRSSATMEREVCTSASSSRYMPPRRTYVHEADKDDNGHMADVDGQIGGGQVSPPTHMGRQAGTLSGLVGE